MVNIEELTNENVDRFFDGVKDNVSYLGYQITVNARQSENLTALENVERIMNIIDCYMQEPKYISLRRIGSPVKTPLATDNNIMTGILRYECHLELNTNTIYRRR